MLIMARGGLVAEPSMRPDLDSDLDGGRDERRCKDAKCAAHAAHEGVRTSRRGRIIDIEDDL